MCAHSGKSTHVYDQLRDPHGGCMRCVLGSWWTVCLLLRARLSSGAWQHQVTWGASGWRFIFTRLSALTTRLDPSRYICISSSENVISKTRGYPRGVNSRSCIHLCAGRQPEARSGHSFKIIIIHPVLMWYCVSITRSLTRPELDKNTRFERNDRDPNLMCKQASDEHVFANATTRTDAAFRF